eukprot:CAMPEP_0113297042 /NCGR_PEP_ID=MMETSP0010_2-20120614/69_1 /TAXON_ID=216773 ORGANISM="Corethron hystrix, Strain 308" /NCGR_SAMPLE_ID=MMETSP0010_2 /ASSEMBLY_ACC=CAM_ASM_000155 /LENGTH=230 /DNA_ID=CAMNT_0000149865 /DNA_START=173 /DNA_END=866 /DNA_ORIENTATION=- /assembly_acc=CAM_ASM_000155
MADTPGQLAKVSIFYDMFYVHNKISRKVYDYCLKNKLADASLIAKWKKPGYERLCSTYVINPKNYKFGTSSICRVPIHDRSPELRDAVDPTSGCRGCASGRGGRENIFGNKYGQQLAAVQVARETAKADEERKRAEARERAVAAGADGAGDSDTDDRSSSDEEDYGPAPPPPTENVTAAAGEGDSETDSDESSDEEDYGPAPPPVADSKRGAISSDAHNEENPVKKPRSD